MAHTPQKFVPPASTLCSRKSSLVRILRKATSSVEVLWHLPMEVPEMFSSQPSCRLSLYPIFSVSRVLCWPDRSCAVSFGSEGKSSNEIDPKTGGKGQRAEASLAWSPLTKRSGPSDSAGGVTLHSMWLCHPRPFRGFLRVPREDGVLLQGRGAVCSFLSSMLPS